MERHKRVWAPMLAGLLLLGACSDRPVASTSDGIEPLEDTEPGPDSGPDPESEPEPAPEAAAPESAEVDITVIPDEITKEYVDAVLVELERLFAEALIVLRTEGELTIEATDRLESIFGERQYELRVAESLRLLENDFAGFRQAGDLRARNRRVADIIDTASDCVYVETVTDFSGLVLAPPDPDTSFVVLRPATGRRPMNLSDTPWVFSQIAVGDSDALQEERPC